MAKFRILIKDPDTGQVVHEVSHPVWAENPTWAINALKQSYGKFQGWILKAVPING